MNCGKCTQNGRAVSTSTHGLGKKISVGMCSAILVQRKAITETSVDGKAFPLTGGFT
jgi:hypothetical protein